MAHYTTEDVIVYTLSLILGIVATIMNGIIIFLAVRNPTLRKGGKCLQIGLACADVIFGFGAVVANVDRLRIAFGSDWYTAYYCIFIYMFLFVGDAFSLILIIMMALERLYAVLWPIRYWNSDHGRWAELAILTAALISVGFFGINFVGVDNNVKPISCVGTAVRHRLLRPMLSYYNCALGVVIVALYASLITIIRWKNRSLKRKHLNEDSRTRNAFRRETAATKLVSVITISCVTFLVIPNVILTVLTAIGVEHVHKIGPYNSLLAICNCAINFFLYIWKDEKMRDAFLTTFYKKKYLKQQPERTIVRCQKSIYTVDLNNVNLSVSEITTI